MPTAQNSIAFHTCSGLDCRVGGFTIMSASAARVVSRQWRLMLDRNCPSTPEALAVHAGRVAPTVAPTRSVQQTASSRGAERLRRDAMTAPHFARAGERVRTQKPGNWRCCSRRVRWRTCRGVGRQQRLHEQSPRTCDRSVKGAVSLPPAQCGDTDKTSLPCGCRTLPRWSFCISNYESRSNWDGSDQSVSDGTNLALASSPSHLDQHHDHICLGDAPTPAHCQRKAEGSSRGPEHGLARGLIKAALRDVTGNQAPAWSTVRACARAAAKQYHSRSGTKRLARARKSRIDRCPCST